MRADRVRPGMLIRHGDTWAVVTAPWAGGRIGFANPSLPELILNPDGDVEAVRLTAPQAAALRTVARGGVHRVCDSEGQNHRWGHDDNAVRRWAPYALIWELTLIGPKDIYATFRSDFDVTPSGRTLLDLLDREGA